MKKKSNVVLLLFIAVNLAVLPIYLSSFSTPKEETVVVKDTVYQKIKIPSIPTSLKFCGEDVPMQRQDIIESFDRELLINTFWHSSTVQSIKRSKYAFEIIEPILKEYGVPDDFKYLAVIESGLVNATSPSGAKGIWQFMEATAPEYGLKVNKEIDERLDIEKATHAACKYLLKAYGKFGSWTLGAASYNMGINGVQRELDDQKMQSYYDLRLNSETARYVFRIIAMKHIFENQTLFGFNLSEEDYYSQMPYKNILVDSTIDNLTKFALENNSNVKLVKFLNPWLVNDRLTVKDDTVNVRIPE